MASMIHLLWERLLRALLWVRSEVMTLLRMRNCHCTWQFGHGALFVPYCAHAEKEDHSQLDYFHVFGFCCGDLIDRRHIEYGLGRSVSQLRISCSRYQCVFTDVWKSAPDKTRRTLQQKSAVSWITLIGSVQKRLRSAWRLIMPLEPFVFCRSVC